MRVAATYKCKACGGLVFGDSLNVSKEAVTDSLEFALKHGKVKQTVFHHCLPDEAEGRLRGHIGICKLVGFQPEINAKLPGE